MRWLTRSGNEDEHIRHVGTAWRPQRLAAVGRAVKAALAFASCKRRLLTFTIRP
ncbi:hypothetical protein [Yersinia hibernica]|uniref:hypothetical protein n=1 Tax=Yersinia hibernica TaxID=2339259 RepID=UPI00187773A3|nr:hypothetical protein [Yersinia hibernica]HDL6679544.1 hypothetical protein [Yersinia enterocolitica]HDL8230357.1 hypothetical protein [Yersinia enterocolitica]HDX8417476.1 hypothetical protein [Yersinia enterocolitica]